jgi:hypothetical protein
MRRVAAVPAPGTAASRPMQLRRVAAVPTPGAAASRPMHLSGALAPPFVDNVVEGWGYLRLLGDTARCHDHVARPSVEDRGEPRKAGTPLTCPGTHFSTFHRPYYCYDPFSNR